MARTTKITGVLWILLAAGGLHAADAGDANDGFVPLFDGKTLTGWNTTGNWIVEEDGIVTLHPREGEHGWQRYDAYLTTARKYKDFVLDLEFKIGPKGNSGVFCRVGDPKSQVKTGFEVQILDTHGKPNPGNHDCGGVIGTAAPSKNMAKPAGEWNRYIITCQGNLLKVELNGEQIIDLELDKSAIKDRPLEGHIGFQDEAKKVSYRNVRIKELK
ncbi:MAG: DUF1080 domain-containing protein [Planctomycetes bacterium]|nr:DUF1080 domain-containing protein [Planctomycetota bacterium]